MGSGTISLLMNGITNIELDSLIDSFSHFNYKDYTHTHDTWIRQQCGDGQRKRVWGQVEVGKAGEIGMERDFAWVMGA